MRVLDLACGEGRHALKAAQWGASVVALDDDDTKLETGREAASRLGVEVDFRTVDLTGEWPDLEDFEVVLLFNYLDRARMADVQRAVATGGLLMMETYLDWQRALGWGPTSDDHLLQPGELARLVSPLEALHGREVFEPIEGNKVRAVASIVAQKL
jgi:SAM-dependent methyltransferase